MSINEERNITSSKPSVLVMSSFYLPGYKAGGAMRSIVGMVEALGDEFDFRIITVDRDLGDTASYPDIPQDVWVTVGKAQVMYLSARKRSAVEIWRLLRDLQYDLLYLNSFFARRFSMLPCFLRRVGLIRRVPIILAPQGEFSAGALRLKFWRKRLYLALARRLSLYREVIWHGASAFEEQDIRNQFGETVSIGVAGSLTVVDEGQATGNLAASAEPRKAKNPGSLKAVFLSRIVPKKNLDGALSLLQGLSGSVQFHIYGPTEDRHYWQACQELIKGLPANIRVAYHGEVRHEEVQSIFAAHDLLLFPTHGENYGHVICEALVAGCPVLISDQTPWRQLQEEGVGWDIALDKPEAFRTVLQKCIDMSADEFEALSKRAEAYGMRWTADGQPRSQNRSLLLGAVQQSPLLIGEQSAHSR
jgi:glycosyltransferase involved in cell wall biosynthesis